MMSPRPSAEARVVAFIDIGTNSIRLLLVRIHANAATTVLAQLKQTVRLGEGEFTDQRLQPAAMDRAIFVCQKFVAMARASGAETIVAVATAATREAVNQNAFLRHLREATGLDVRVVSGLEEARLIYLGVASGVHLGDKRVLFIDIGGGSTEVTIGTQQQYQYLNSLKLGAIRLTTQLLPNLRGPVSAECYARLQHYVRHNIVHTLRELRSHHIDCAVGSSGTIENLADVAARLFWKRQRQPDDILTADQLKEVVSYLCAQPLAERRKTPGLNPGRADIIIAGGAILQTFVEELGLPYVHITERGLRDGLLVDYLVKHGYAPLLESMSVRQHSVLQLGRACQFNERHAETTARLALALFDSAREAKLHGFGAWERELLEYAALLHHIGAFLTYSNYQAHTYYLIRNANLLGFDQTEVELIACLALYHRKAAPRKKHPEFAALNKSARHMVRTLSALLRLAENLDRSQAGYVSHAALKAVSPKRVVLQVRSNHDCQIELWGVQKATGVFEKVFDRSLKIKVIERLGGSPTAAFA